MTNTSDPLARGRTSSIGTFKATLVGLALVLGVGLGNAANPGLTEPTGDIHAHDPSMIKAGKTWYVFATGDEGGLNDGSLQIRQSSGMREWTFAGTVFETTPAWITTQIGKVPNLWAPDISYADGKYWLYYAASHFGTNESVIGLATNTTLDAKNPKYRWIDKGMVIRSRGGTDDWNAIDPNRTVDANGQPWLAFGSYWDGIKLRRLDSKTGKLSSRDSTLYPLASRHGGAVEAPSLIYRNGFYYLFTSFDACCRGAESTYNIRVGRSRKITGPYVDEKNVPLSNGGGSLLLGGHDRVRGPGGQTVRNDRGTFRMVYHYYDGDVFGEIKFLIQTLKWTADGWPRVQ